MAQQQPPVGPPYPPTTAIVGGVPTTEDIIICAVLLCFYLASAIINMIIFQKNRTRNHKFIPSAMLFGFSMARILTLSLRMAWAKNHQNISLAIAATIFVNIGVIIVFILNLLFAQRILRARHLRLGWSRALHVLFIMLYLGIVVAIIMIVTLTVMSFYTRDMSILEDAKWIQRGAIIYFLISAVAPLLFVALAITLPSSTPPQSFGSGSLQSKAMVLVIGACLCTVIEGFHVGTACSPARPASRPAWYDSRAAFYVFNFCMEILVLCLYIGFRVDQRFHVPDGSSKRRTYVLEANSDSESEKGADSSDDVEKRRDSGLADPSL